MRFGAVDLQLLIGEINLRLQERLGANQVVPERAEMLGEPPEKLPRRFVSALRSSSAHQIDHRLCLCQIDLAVQKGALGKLSRLRGARPAA